MTKLFVKIAIKFLRWLMISKGTHLHSFHLLRAGWVIEEDEGIKFFVEPRIKSRDKVWISLHNYYYRVYHGERRTFVSLESTVEWPQFYLLCLDKNLECKTRRLEFTKLK
jgi:hypothetical protein